MTNRLVGVRRRRCGEENVHNLMQHPTLFDNTAVQFPAPAFLGR
jgi:hypothetical protein